MARTFYIHHEDASPRSSLGTVSTPTMAKKLVADHAAGVYHMRDCLGGLRARIRRNDDGTTTVLEVTK